MKTKDARAFKSPSCSCHDRRIWGNDTKRWRQNITREEESCYTGEVLYGTDPPTDVTTTGQCQSHPDDHDPRFVAISLVQDVDTGRQ